MLLSWPWGGCERAWLIFSSLFLLCVSACKDSKQNAPEPEPETAPAPAACATDSDCPDTWICLASKCSNPNPAAIYTDPSNAVTPDKVGREIEQLGQQREQDVDREVESAQ